MFGTKKKIIPQTVQMDNTFETIVRRMIHENEWTQDIAYLDRFEWRLLFVVDDLKLRFKGHEDVRFCCSAFTQKNFEFIRSIAQPELPAIPLQRDIAERIRLHVPPVCKIKGQLLAVRPKILKQLDIERQNGVKYLRRKVDLIIPYRELRKFPTTDVHGRELPKVLQGKEEMHFLTEEKVYLKKALMYVGNPEVWDQFIDAGYNFQAIPTFAPKSRDWMTRYYNFYEDS